jgi:hypothetical protein
MTRDELNERARELGIEEAEQLPNKAAVLAAIEEAEASSLELSVVSAVQRDLKDLAKRAPDLARSGLAASALALARALDDPGNSATSKSMCAKALLETLARLFEQAPAKQENDRIDELNARRTARLAANG